jgi:homoserine dehydrogenase
MTEEGVDFSSPEEAQALGYAEADPTDIEGIDSAHKHYSCITCLECHFHSKYTQRV